MFFVEVQHELNTLLVWK